MTPGVSLSNRPLLLLGVLLLILGVQFISIGLIGELIIRVYYKSQSRLTYVVREELNCRRIPRRYGIWAFSSVRWPPPRCWRRSRPDPSAAADPVPFGNLSIVAPLANVALLPMVPSAMLFGAIALAGGMIWLPLGQWLALPAYLFLAWLTKGARFVRQAALRSGAVPLFPLWLLLAYYRSWLVAGCGMRRRKEIASWLASGERLVCARAICVDLAVRAYEISC